MAVLAGGDVRGGASGFVYNTHTGCICGMKCHFATGLFSLITCLLGYGQGLAYNSAKTAAKSAGQ